MEQNNQVQVYTNDTNIAALLDTVSTLCTLMIDTGLYSGEESVTRCRRVLDCRNRVVFWLNQSDNVLNTSYGNEPIQVPNRMDMDTLVKAIFEHNEYFFRIKLCILNTVHVLLHNLDVHYSTLVTMIDNGNKSTLQCTQLKFKLNYLRNQVDKWLSSMVLAINNEIVPEPVTLVDYDSDLDQPYVTMTTPLLSPID